MDLSWLNFDTGSAIVFVLLIGFLVWKYRSKLTFQKLVHIGKVPILYIVLWKTQFGLKFMERVGTKHRELVKLVGTCFIGFGFVGMIFISIQVLYLLFQLFTHPKIASEGVSLILPLTHIPGVGYLSFWHFLITLFFVILVHEFAHGIVARAHNVPVKSSGLGAIGAVIPLIPLAFVEPDEKKMAKDSDIVQYSILAAGPMVNIVFAILVLLLSNLVFAPIENRITHPVGLSFTEAMEGFGAADAGLAPGMVISSVNGVEVLDYPAFTKQVGDLKPGQTLTFGTDKGTFSVITEPSPENTEKGYIGIKGIQNERRVNAGLEAVGPTFFWTKGLLRWLYFLNVAIGLMNLLPLIITDGGRMLKLAFEKTFKDQKKAQKAWTFVGGIFLFTLLAAFVVKAMSGLF